MIEFIAFLFILSFGSSTALIVMKYVLKPELPPITIRASDRLEDIINRYDLYFNGKITYQELHNLK